MTRWSIALVVLCGLACALAADRARAASGERIRLTVDTSEADRVLAILALREAGKPVPEAEWRKLFATPPYQRLKQRERKIAERTRDSTRVFSDDDFKRFVLGDDLLGRASRLRSTLEQWKQADLQQSGRRVLAYLPDSAVIRAKVYPVIKPRTNSFVWELSSDPTIFLYLDPEVTRDKFENTVAHELHHVGISSLGPVYERTIAPLPERARDAAGWMAGFGEGLAMLAAAGGPDVDPHATSTPEERATWQTELAGFDADLPAVDRFFLDVLGGRIDADSAQVKGMSFFGEHQGPWYTVGYRMAVLVEQRYGRPALIGTMLDYRCLLALYNRAGAEGSTRPPLWSEELLSGVGATRCGPR